MKRGYTPRDLDSIEFEVFDFTDDWFEAFDKPEISGVWFIWGNSGNGKTSFYLKLTKYLTTFNRKVVINSLEEGRSKTMQGAFRKAGMNEVSGKVLLVQESMEDLEERLDKERSAKIVVIDSWQYTNWTYKKYEAFKKRYPNKLIIIVSQADGKAPSGRPAKAIKYDADLKIWVEGHRAISMGRYIGKKGYYTNWIEGAAKYWGQEAID
ncbi:MAG TPA: hypothetical protein VK541_11275 [Pedobacter sp.]|uniref:hypothetical protein n=1 Tax=Pedobacter sp. TaxID=1411316 RepID=UPI002B7B1E3E|nr:hypothetical protein [Pedobacter sp.]HMI03056.1 hypothetical protein [Pedobacter sp.]